MNQKQTSQSLGVGLAYALAAYFSWGLVPIFWKELQHVSAMEILAHRVIWACFLLALYIAFQNGWRTLREQLAKPGVKRNLLLSSGFLAVNWFVFIYSVNSNRILQTSLGYYINPLITVVMGRVFLGESMRRTQWVCFAIAMSGILVFTIGLGTLPTLALALAFTFAVYGLLRKTVPIAPLYGLWLETCIISIPAVVYLVSLTSQGDGVLGQASAKTHVFLVLSGAVTALPLLWFGKGVKRLNLTTIGFLQYISPSCTFLLSVLLYGETFTRIHLITFALIWLALIIYSGEGALNAIRKGRDLRRVPVQGDGLTVKRRS